MKVWHSSAGIDLKTNLLSLCLCGSAIAFCVQGCSLLETRSETLVDAAKRKQEGGDFAGAIRDCNQAIELEPGNGELYHLRGLMRETRGDLEGSLRDFDRAAELRPWDDAVFRSKVEARRALLDRLEHLTPDSLVKDRVLLRMRIVTTRILLTGDLYGLLNIDPENTWAYGERGRLRLDCGDAQGAIDDFTTILNLDSDATWAYFNRGLAEAALEDYSAAIQDFTRVLESDGTDGWAFYERGLARVYAGDHDEGCSDLRRAMDLGVDESESAIEDLCQ